MFGNVVNQIDSELFEDVLSRVKNMRKVTLDIDLSADDLKLVVEQYKEIYKDEIVRSSSGSHDQLWSAIDSVFKSWSNTRAKKYRELNNITGLLGTAVNVQTMSSVIWVKIVLRVLLLRVTLLQERINSLESSSLMLRARTW